MSKGSRIVPVRFDDAAYAAMVAEIERYNSNPCVEHKTVSEWIRIAVAEKIAYHGRGRRSKQKTHL